MLEQGELWPPDTPGRDAISRKVRGLHAVCDEYHTAETRACRNTLRAGVPRPGGRRVTDRATEACLRMAACVACWIDHKDEREDIAAKFHRLLMHWDAWRRLQNGSRREFIARPATIVTSKKSVKGTRRLWCAKHKHERQLGKTVRIMHQCPGKDKTDHQPLGIFAMTN